MYLIRSIALLALLILSGGVVHALSDTPQTEVAQGSVFLAGVSIIDVSLALTERTVTVDFTLTNEGGVQPGVRYGLLLMEKGETGMQMVDEFVFDETLTLGDGESVSREVVYTPGETLGGSYELFVVSKSEHGFPFGMVRAGTIVLSTQETPLMLSRESCYLRVVSRDGGVGTRVPQGSVPNLQEGETLMSHCSLTNGGQTEIVGMPRYTTMLHGIYGTPVAVEGGSYESFTLLPNEKKEIERALPRPTLPGYYEVTVAYDGKGSNAVFAYRIGEGPEVVNVILDKKTYAPGDTALVSVVTKGTGEYTLAVGMTGARNAECAPVVTQKVALSGYTRSSISVPISASCTNVRVEAALTDGKSTVFATQEYEVEVLGQKVFVPAPVVTQAESKLRLGAPFFISIIGLAIGLGFFYHMLYRRTKKNAMKVPLILLALFCGPLFFGASQAEAVSFAKDGCLVTASVDQGRYKTGDTITVSGSISGCSGTSLAAGFNDPYNTGTQITGVTSGWYSGTLVTPSLPGALHGLFFDGDWLTGPFNYGNPTRPYEPVVINMCAVTGDNYCMLPPYESYFGEPIGWSGGACGGASQGTCNYTCEADLSWKRNSNTCSTPVIPPPAPGTTPEFRSVPSCIIQANATVCSALVQVFVPSTYMFGADLKTCGGTHVTTVPPGTHNVSVQIPYNTVCLNLHPWSIIPAAPTDTVNGTSACTPGTNWDGTTCRALPTPGVPTNVEAFTWGSCGSKTIKLRWSPVSGATYYDVLRDGTEIIGSTPLPFFDNNVADGSTHTYQVRAVNASGASVWSTPPVTGTAPAACAMPSATLGASSCDIAIGASACTAYVSWSVSNYTSPNMLHNGIQFSTAQNGSEGRPVTIGSHTFTLRDGITILEERIISAQCESGSSWNGSVCQLGVTSGSNLPCGQSEYLGCIRDARPHGASHGSCNPVTHTGTCSYTCDNGNWTAPSFNNCALNSTPPVVSGPPTLTPSSRTVRINTPVTLRWDTNNGNEGLCSLTGGTLRGSQSPIPLDPSDINAEEGTVTQTVQGRTTFTLSCPSGSVSTTIEIIPEDSES